MQVYSCLSFLLKKNKQQIYLRLDGSEIQQRYEEKSNFKEPRITVFYTFRD